MECSAHIHHGVILACVGAELDLSEASRSTVSTAQPNCRSQTNPVCFQYRMHLAEKEHLLITVLALPSTHEMRLETRNRRLLPFLSVAEQYKSLACVWGGLRWNHIYDWKSVDDQLDCQPPQFYVLHVIYQRMETVAG